MPHRQKKPSRTSSHTVGNVPQHLIRVDRSRAGLCEAGLSGDLPGIFISEKGAAAWRQPLSFWAHFHVLIRQSSDWELPHSHAYHTMCRINLSIPFSSVHCFFVRFHKFLRFRMAISANGICLSIRPSCCLYVLGSLSTEKTEGSGVPCFPPFCRIYRFPAPFFSALYNSCCTGILSRRGYSSSNKSRSAAHPSASRCFTSSRHQPWAAYIIQ